jgi:hypothetical protein
VRGIQASVALLLAKAAVELAARGNWDGLEPIDPALSLAIAGTACGVLLALRGSTRIPGALVVLAAGAGVGLASGGLPEGLSLGPGEVSLTVPDGTAFGVALTSLVLAQIPLTFGNSVVATADAERTYYGARARRVRPGRLAASISVANSAAGLTSGLPVCHGAGGATAHYKLGARRAGATIAAGAVFLGLALGLGSSLPALLMVLAPGALAGMLLFVAIQHGLLAATLERLDDRLVAAGVGLVTLASGNLGIGFAAGVAALGLRSLLRRGRSALAGRPVPV